MIRGNKVFCDECGDEIDLNSNYYYIEIYGRNTPKKKNFDFCNESHIVNFFRKKVERR